MRGISVRGALPVALKTTPSRIDSRPTRPWNSTAMATIATTAITVHGTSTLKMVLSASLAKYAQPPISDPSNTT